MPNRLILVRHGQSEWNLKNLFTGWRDPGLTPKGIEEAERAGTLLKERSYKIDCAFTSDLSRAQKTLDLILDGLGQTDIPITRDERLNERDYGDLAGLNKDDAREKWGEEQVHIWRRSYDIAPPGGESLRDTGARVWPYYIHQILPQVMQQKTVIVAAHGNSLRALVMALEGMSKVDIVKREIATGVPAVYELASDSSVKSVEIITQ